MVLEKDSILHNRYRIEQQLGQGGMGAVYLAVDKTLDIKVAVKENLNLNPESERQFKREASLLAGLRHPNLPRVSDHFVREGRQYLVMDFVEGENLRARSERQLPTIDEVIEWADAVCRALAYLHSREPPIIHRDIKPANIKLTPQGEVMLVDFGLAKIFDQKETDTGARGLTPGFSPPEQHGSRRTDARSDQYALAATLYALLTGEPPADSIERMVGAERLIPPRELNPDIPGHVDRALRQALSLAKLDRFPDIQSFAAALHAGSTVKDWGESLTILGRKAAAATTSRPWLRPALGLVGLGSVLLIILWLTGVLGTGANRPATSQPTAAVLVAVTRTALRPRVRTPTVAPSQAPQPTDTPDLAITPTPTTIELSSPDDPRRFVNLSEPSYQDGFDDPTTWFDYDTEGRAAYTFHDGQLLGVDYQTKEDFIWWTYVERSSGNVYTEVSATIGGCAGKDAVGFALRVDPETASGGYGLEVSCDGYWRFLRYAQSLPGQALQDWTKSEAILDGADATNRLAIWGYRNEFFAFINNQRVGRAVDPRSAFSYGTFALYVRAARTDHLTAQFDDFAFYHIPYIPE